MSINVIIAIALVSLSFLFIILSQRITNLRNIFESYMNAMNYKGYINAKAFIKAHESLPGLSEFEQLQLEGARKLVNSYELFDKEPKKN